MKKLPESFGIMRDAENPLWDKYIAWLKKEYNACIDGDMDIYYGVGISFCGFHISETCDTILTLEQWDSIVNGWQPKNGEEIEVWENDEWIKAEFIGMDGKLFVACTKFGYFNYKQIRQINPIREEIEELKDRIKELEGRL